MRLLTTEQLEKLTTQRLLAYRNSLLKCNEWPNDDNGAGLEYSKVAIRDGNNYVGLYKNSPLWKAAYAELKRILATREHLE